MKERNRTRLLLDIVLTIFFISLLFAKATGFAFHEIAGLAMGVLLLYHIVLNWSWVKSITKNLFIPRLKSKPRLFYLLNAVSLLAVATIMITGVQISMVLFPSDEMISHTLIDVHKWAAYACVGLFGLHIALHWQFIGKNLPTLFRAPARPAWNRAGLIMAAILLILSLLYTQSGASSKHLFTENAALSEDTPPASVQSQPEMYADRPRHGHGHGPGRINPREAITYDQNIPSYAQPTAGDNPVVNSSEALSQSRQDSAATPNDSIASGNDNDKPSLNQYLGSLFCDGCEKHCSLLSLRCDRGIPQLEAAQQQYQAIYMQ